MAEVNKETTNSTNSGDVKSVFDLAGASITVSDSVRSTIVGLNTGASGMDVQSRKAREVTYEFVAALCDAAHKMGNDDDFLIGVQKVMNSLLSASRVATQDGLGVNPFRNLCAIADGAWVTKFNPRSGSKTVSWEPNRSSEKFAGICRFATRNGLLGADMLRHFMSGEPFKIPLPNGDTKKVKATINAVIAEDSKQHRLGERRVLDNDDWEAILNLQPLAVVPFTNRLEQAFALSEGGLIFGAMRVVGDKVYILGDAGLGEGNPTLRQFKNSRKAIRERFHLVSKMPEEAATLPEEYEINL